MKNEFNYQAKRVFIVDARKASLRTGNLNVLDAEGAGGEVSGGNIWHL